MPFDIIVRFESEKVADEWCGQMSDGFGEGYCDFSFWRQKPGTDGKKKEDFEKVVEGGKPVYFMNRLFDIE